MYSNNIVNFQESTTILKCPYEKSQKTYRIHLVSFQAKNLPADFRMNTKIIISVCSYVFQYIDTYIFSGYW